MLPLLLQGQAEQSRSFAVDMAPATAAAARFAARTHQHPYVAVDVTYTAEERPQMNSEPTFADGVSPRKCDTAAAGSPAQANASPGRGSAAARGRASASLADHLAGASRRFPYSLLATGDAAPRGSNNASTWAGSPAINVGAISGSEHAVERSASHDAANAAGRDGSVADRSSDTPALEHAVHQPTTSAETAGPAGEAHACDGESGRSVTILIERALHLHPHYAAADGSDARLRVCAGSDASTPAACVDADETGGACVRWDSLLEARTAHEHGGDLDQLTLRVVRCVAALHCHPFRLGCSGSCDHAKQSSAAESSSN